MVAAEKIVSARVAEQDVVVATRETVAVGAAP